MVPIEVTVGVGAVVALLRAASDAFDLCSLLPLQLLAWDLLPLLGARSPASLPPAESICDDDTFDGRDRDRETENSARRHRRAAG
ncbi:MAG: hypothetical protein M3292_10970 [Actinomycetota bacterium]|nr:hypothetical protein [Actinomycetota bacterium]